MKKFSFPLQNVLRLRHHQAEQARERLEAISRAVHDQEAAVEAARRERDRVSEAPATGTLRPEALRQKHAFRAAAQRAFEEAQRRLDDLRRKEAEARAELLRRSQAEEALHTLRDHALQEHTDAEAADEARFLDEQGVSGYVRRHA